MAEVKKRKTRDDINQRKSKPEKKRKQFPSKNVAIGRNKKKKKNSKDEQNRTGPRLPSALRRDLEVLKPNPKNSGDEENYSDEEDRLLPKDVCEYEEPVPEEENIVVSEAYLESEPVYSKLCNRLEQLKKVSSSVQSPLTRVEREKVNSKMAYKNTLSKYCKWKPLVKVNTEPLCLFKPDTDVELSNVGEIVSEFKPRTDFEKKTASVLLDSEAVDAHKMDGARVLERNKISVEDENNRHNRLAKIRSLLLRHEMKVKHIKKIKSKAFPRKSKKDKKKASSAERQMDLESAKELAMKQGFKQAEERMKLKHKKQSKWAKKRGLAAQDKGTRAAISEQLHQHALLTRKMNSMKDNSSRDNSDEDEDLPPVTDKDGAFKLVTKAK